MKELFLKQSCVKSAGGYVLVTTAEFSEKMHELDSVMTYLTGKDHTRKQFESSVYECDQLGRIRNLNRPLEFRYYDTEEEANAGHERMCQKWAEIPTF